MESVPLEIKFLVFNIACILRKQKLTEISEKTSLFCLPPPEAPHKVWRNLTHQSHQKSWNIQLSRYEHQPETSYRSVPERRESESKKLANRQKSLCSPQLEQRRPELRDSTEQQRRHRTPIYR